MELINALVNAWRLPDLRAKLLYTAALLAVFRFIAHVPVPGVDTTQLQRLFANNQFVGLLDIFSGGALATFSIGSMCPMIPVDEAPSPQAPPVQRMKGRDLFRSASNPAPGAAVIPPAGTDDGANASLSNSDRDPSRDSSRNPRDAVPHESRFYQRRRRPQFLGREPALLEISPSSARA